MKRKICVHFSNLPCDMKNGIRNLPETTILLRSCNVVPSNGKAPQTKTYKTTPKLHISARGPSYSRPKKTYIPFTHKHMRENKKQIEIEYATNPIANLLCWMVLFSYLWRCIRW